jgi:hypothetical protein
MAPALEAAIKNHLESKSPVILEGDFILPALAAQTERKRQEAAKLFSPYAVAG